MQLNLKDCWLDFAVLQHLLQHVGSDVANTDVAHKSFRNELLHRLVSHLVSHTFSELHSWYWLIISEIDPFRWIN
jgi:hypothetical protein